MTNNQNQGNGEQKPEVASPPPPPPPPPKAPVDPKRNATLRKLRESEEKDNK